MSTRASRRKTPCRTLAEYLFEIIKRLGDNDPAALERIKGIVRDNRARVIVDDESVVFGFVEGVFKCFHDKDGTGVDGEGRTNRGTVLDLIDGYVEVGEAISDDSLMIVGQDENIIKIFQSIEIILDCSTRIPALQELCEDYRIDPCLKPVQEIIASGISRNRRLQGRSGSHPWRNKPDLKRTR